MTTMRETGELVWRTILILAVAALVIALTASCTTEGTRRGVVTRVDLNPQYIRCKSWVGELLLDDVSGDGAQASEANRWVFSITNMRVVVKLQRSYSKRVTVRYHVGTSPCQGASGFIVDGVVE